MNHPIHAPFRRELEQLEELLVSDDVPADCMNLEMLDGYLAAIVASPLPIPVENWLPPYGLPMRARWVSAPVQRCRRPSRWCCAITTKLVSTIGDEEGDEEGEAEGWQPFCYAQGGDATIRPSAKNGARL
jgi:uncharacterized protein